MKQKIIKFLYKVILKRVFFLFNPERVHDLLTFSGRMLGTNKITRSLTSLLFNYKNESYLTQTIAGIKFINPVGLSTGFDKEAGLIKIMPSVGFGFESIGSVTWEGYKGNPKPRLYRLKKSKGLVVYYGLKNPGAKIILKRVESSKKIIKNFPVCVSIAKTNCEGNEKESIEDYFKTIELFCKNKVGDFYEINISCPNTFGGEPFTTPDKLKRLLNKISKIKFTRPVFIKMPINFSWEEFNDLLKVMSKFTFIKGVTIGNLNKNHSDSAILDNIPANIKGAVSGKPTWELSNYLISKTYKEYRNRFIINGVGGIFSANDAYTKIKLGASIISLITGMIFEGPGLIGEINKGLVELLKKDGYKNISEAVGKT